ncbi:SpoIIE family protein phosphatase [Acanthopleuribacter pedis]|uniref:SpoIIE family protein phosphatase n=1 Tax=Acanthopleuribacter pedis TaxID=442870 RepID=A0A8J7QQP5_9BACT|nr:SpoIIE family protein phosphatase [Acanthopleuribacter pedis]MBO1322420.1 SpoIIE family protein phosphatase [Acanthopleuribacter pedis]
MESQLKPMETVILTQFLRDYLNRFNAYKMNFGFRKGAFEFAGQARNTNTAKLDGVEYDLEPMLQACEAPGHVSIGGDFVVGFDYEPLTETGAITQEVGLSIFDTANHGYDAFFLSGHIRGLLLNILDAHIRDRRRIENHIFTELNNLLKGPLTQALVKSTNPSRATRTRGAVGLHGQFHVDTGDFNFVCTGLPVFYYSSVQNRFIYLEPNSGPPLGYFSENDAFYKPYVPHNVKLHPGDYLILATDGCFESECYEDLCPALGAPPEPIGFFRYPENFNMENTSAFSLYDMAPDEIGVQNDPDIQSFCHFLQPYVASGVGASLIVQNALEAIKETPYFNFDDKSLIVVKALGEEEMIAI